MKGVSMNKFIAALLVMASLTFMTLCYAGDPIPMKQNLPPGWETIIESPDMSSDSSRLDKLIQMKVIPIEPAQVNDWKTEANTKFTPYVGAGASGAVAPEQVIRPVAPMAPVIPSTPKLP
jgi:hypothetical protein